MQPQRVYNFTKSELNQIVALHTQVLDESVLNKLGKPFLKVVYKSITKNPKNIIYIYHDQNKIVGFLVATTNSSHFIKDILRHSFFDLATYIIFSAHRLPMLFLRILKWFFAPKSQDYYPAELQFIAIDPAFQGQGLGKKLLKNLKEDFLRKGVKRYKVGTKLQNLKSNNFYLKQGFMPIYQKKSFGDEFQFYLSPE